MKGFHDPGEDSENEGFYYVEKILDKKQIDNEIKYLVKWKDWPISNATWEAPDNLSNVPEKIKEFENSLKLPETKTIIKKENLQTNPETTIKSKVLDPKGNILFDTPLKLLDGEFKNEKLYIRVEWKKRKDGSIPESSLCLFSDVRAKVPDMVLSLLESKVMTPNGLWKRNKKE